MIIRPHKKPSITITLLVSFLLGSFLGSSPANAQQNKETITIDGQPCGPHGSAREGTKEYDQNVLKNRWQFPGTVTVLDWNDLINGNATRDKFNSDMAVEIVGYVEKVKASGKETCNCKSSNSLFTDTHIELTPSADQTGPQYRISVEVTPRMRQILDEDYGEDWTSSNLKNKLLHRMVRIQGWMFYDGSHESADYTNDPNDERGEKNRRATSWEIHPVTHIEPLEEEYADLGGDDTDYDGEGTSGPVVNPRPSTNNHPPHIPPMNPTEHSPAEWLQIILLAMILGIVGQLIRAVVGISKESAKVASGETNAGFRTAELLFSLLISMAVGAVAGVLAAVNAGEWKGGEMITAFIAAGYAGTDFIEGWMKKSGTGGGAGPARNTPGTPAAGTIPPDAPARVVVP